MNNNMLAKRIREEQELVYRPYNVDEPLNDTDTNVKVDKKRIKQ